MPKTSALTSAPIPLTGTELVALVVTPNAANNPKQATTGDLAFLAGNDTTVVANQAAMLALANAKIGTIVRRSDTLETYRLDAQPATSLGNWILIATAVNPAYDSELADHESRLGTLEGSSVTASFAPTVRAAPIDKPIDEYLQQTDNTVMAGHCIWSYQFAGTWYQIRVFVGYESTTGFRHAFITQRTLPDGMWSAAIDLSLAVGTGNSTGNTSAATFAMQFYDPHTGTTGAATHSALSCAVSEDGRIHVMGNVHNDPMNYVISNAANSITSGWTDKTPYTTNMIVAGGSHAAGTATDLLAQQSSSYPKFCKLKGASDKSLYLLFRDTQNIPGGNNMTTGDSRWWLYKWDDTTHTWYNPLGANHPLLDGHASGGSPLTPTFAAGMRGNYSAIPCAGTDGKIHVFWTNHWDPTDTTSLVGTQHYNELAYEDINYVYVLGGGAGANDLVKKRDGTTITLAANQGVLNSQADLLLNTPTPANVNDTAAMVGIENPQSEVDVNNNPHVMFKYGVEGVNGQYRHIYWNGTAWQTVTLDGTVAPIWNQFDSGTIVQPIQIGTKMYAMMSKNGIRVVDVTPGNPQYGKQNFLIADFSPKSWRGGYDPEALIRRKELHIGLNDAGLVTANTDVASVRNRMNVIMSYDATQFSQVAQRSVPIPRIRSLQSASFPRFNSEIVATTSLTSSWKGCMISNAYQGVGLLVAQLFVQGRVSAVGTTMNIELWETGAAAPLSTLKLVGNTTDSSVFQAWIPILLTPVHQLEVRAWVSGGGSGFIDAGEITIQLGILDEQLQGRGY